ncbi:MAG: MBL fold metallo-hydrolase [Clostridia bacterium]|nr:MBL fold metallo-hydrolase [Clostridia bacterium]
MIEITTLSVGPLGANAYILSNGQNAFVIDPGDEAEKIEQIIIDKGLKLSAVLLTHGHFDHCNGAKYLQNLGAKVYLHYDDKKLIETDGNLARFCSINFNRFSPDFLIGDGDKIDFGGNDISVIHTPGHTDGSVCYLIGNKLFSGDTLFFLSVGRVDFPSGSAEKMRKSLVKLCNLDENITVFSGHGEQTSIGFEKKNNPYVEI